MERITAYCGLVRSGSLLPAGGMLLKKLAQQVERLVF
jgi:hypothetical protein